MIKDRRRTHPFLPIQINQGLGHTARSQYIKPTFGQQEDHPFVIPNILFLFGLILMLAKKHMEKNITITNVQRFCCRDLIKQKLSSINMTLFTKMSSFPQKTNQIHEQQVGWGLPCQPSSLLEYRKFEDSSELSSY